MTRVCLLGAPDASLPGDLLAYETARGALASYEIEEPYANTLCVETISLGAAVSLLNDLEWYLVRLVDEAIVLEPSVSDSEWLSRDLAAAVRTGEVDPDETGDLLEIYGVVDPSSRVDGGAEDEPEQDHEHEHGDGDRTEAEAEAEAETEDARGHRAGTESPAADGASTDEGRADGEGGRPRLADPMFAQRIGDEVPEYDLRDVDETLVVRVTSDEFGG